MKFRLFPVLQLLFGLLVTAGGAWADGGWRHMPPDDRRQMRQEMREHWQQERELRQNEAPRHWRDVPPEDRRRMREELREQRGDRPPPDVPSSRREGGERG